MSDDNLFKSVILSLFTLTAACGSVGPMADDDVGDDTIADDGGDDGGDDGMPEPDAAPPPPEPDAPPPPECTSDDQCPAEEPICDDQSCRGCELDSECPSGACNYDTGACLAESEVLYVAPFGTGPCTHDTPCGNLTDAVPRVTAAKNHILVAPGVYTGRVTFSAAVTVHGYGAQLTSSGSAGAYTIPNATVLDNAYGAVIRLRGLTIAAHTTSVGTSPNVAVATTFGNLVLEDVELVGTGIGSGGAYSYMGTLTGRRVTIRAAGVGLGTYSAYIALDRCRILDSGAEGLSLVYTMFEVKNTVIARSAKTGVIVDGGDGFGTGPQRLAFNTFVDNGTAITSDGTDIQCKNGSAAEVENNLVKSVRPYTWAGASNGGIRPVGGECVSDMRFNLFDQPGHPGAWQNIAGPSDLAVSAPGLAVDAHLLPSSLAIDAADPDAELTTDADGNPRPAGAGRDIGAYEYQP